MDCLHCGGSLEGRVTDDRVEWTREDYACKDCELPHERLTVYQTQSRLVESDELSIDYDAIEFREQLMPAKDEAPLTTCPWCGIEYNVKETDGNKYYEQVEQSAYYQHNGVSPDTGMEGAIADRECGKFVKFVGGHFCEVDEVWIDASIPEPESEKPTCRSVLQMIQDGAREILRGSEEREYLDTGYVIEWMNDSIIKWNIDALKD